MQLPRRPIAATALAAATATALDLAISIVIARSMRSMRSGLLWTLLRCSLAI